MKKSRVFDMATAWTFKEIVKQYLPEEEKLKGGYIGAKYRKVKITIIVEKVGKVHE